MRSTRRLPLWTAIVCLTVLLTAGCVPPRQAYTITQSTLKLSRVVLYRNGIGYFERVGVVDGDRLAIKVRKDQVDDLLKSLTVIDRSSQKPLSIAIPLDPRAWQDAALGMLTPGRGNLAQVLDALRGSYVAVETADRNVRGRIVMVERIAAQFAPNEPVKALPEDHKLTLLDGDTLQVLQLSQVLSIRLAEGDLIMQLDRHLDATAGEGMFQQVEVVAHFADDAKHDLAVSYVAAAPLWKPTYRLVLAEDGSGKALLQAWAVVSNVTGENWDRVQLALTSGAPLAFRYDLHTPEDVERPDLTQSTANKHARVSIGESSYAPPSPSPSAPPPSAAAAPAASADASELEERDEASGAPAKSASARSFAKKDRKGAERERNEPSVSALDLAVMSAQRAPDATAKRVAGLTRFDIAQRLSLPDGAASMVQLVNQIVPGEQTFLYKPGGSGQGYEYNPYRVVRFQNDTDFVLEPGPISIYAGGSFVGEGISEAIGSHDRATIPFAAEPSIIVHNSTTRDSEALRISKIVHGVLEVESFQRISTTWNIQTRPSAEPIRVLLRQARAGEDYKLIDPPKDTETLPDGYFIPLSIAANQTTGSLVVVEQTPSKYQLDVWDDKAPELLKQLLATTGLDAKARAALEPIALAREAIGRIDTTLSGLASQESELDDRADQERQNLLAIQKDPKAAGLRKRLSQRLEQLTQQAAELGRKIVELNSQRMERKIELEDQLRDLNIGAQP
jgi:hypothetical protein